MVLWAGKIILYATGDDDSKRAYLFSLLIETLCFVLNSIVYLLTKTRFKTWLVKMILVLDTVTLVLQTINYDFLFRARGEDIAFALEIKLSQFRYMI